MDYALGIAESDRAIVMIEKTKPAWQAGKFNFVGGKIEPKEEPIDCMVREFKEETGVDTKAEDWKYVGIMKRENDFNCHVYYMKSELAHGVDTQEEEKVYLIEKEIFLHDTELQSSFMPNIMALYHFATSSDFDKYNASLIINYP